jgi:hippurate hydrolase
VDDFWVTLTGRGGHAAYPHDTLDPIPGACALVSALQTIPSRNADPLKQLVVSVTQVHAGSAINVIPPDALVTGTVRSFDPATQGMARRRVKEIVHGTAAAFGLEARLDYQTGYPATVNDPASAAFAAEVARDVAAHVDDRIAPGMGAEDFSYMLQVRPGAYLYLGNGDTPFCHHPAFDFDDRAAPVGASFFARVVERALPIQE